MFVDLETPSTGQDGGLSNDRQSTENFTINNLGKLTAYIYIYIYIHVYIYIYIYICQRERSNSIQTIHAWDATLAQDPLREQKEVITVRHVLRVRGTTSETGTT